MEQIAELEIKDYKQYPVGSTKRTQPWLDKMDAAAKAFDEAHRQHTE